MNEILALVGKDLRLLVRDKAGFFFTFVMPLLFCVVFGTMFSSEPEDMRIGVHVVDLDQTEESARFVKELEDSDELATTDSTREMATEAVRRGKTTAYIILPEGFGASRSLVFWGEGPKLIVGVDPSRKAEAGMLQGVLTRQVFSGMTDMFTKPDRMRAQLQESITELRSAEDMDPVERTTLLAFLPALDAFLAVAPTFDSGAGPGIDMSPVEVEDVIPGSSGPSIDNGYVISFPQGIMWGAISCAASFAISLVIERNSGTLVRLCTARVSRSAVLMGKAGACFVVVWGLQAVLLGLGALVFGIQPASYAMLVLSITSIAVAFVGMMMLLSVVGKTEQAAAGIGWAAFLVMAMIGGAMVPRLFMPSWMTSISAASPVRWAIESLEGAIWRHYSLGEMMVPCGILIAVGLGSFLIGTRLFRWTE